MNSSLYVDLKQMMIELKSGNRGWEHLVNLPTEWLNKSSNLLV